MEEKWRRRRGEVEGERKQRRRRRRRWRKERRRLIGVDETSLVRNLALSSGLMLFR